MYVILAELGCLVKLKPSDEDVMEQATVLYPPIVEHYLNEDRARLLVDDLRSG